MFERRRRPSLGEGSLNQPGTTISANAGVTVSLRKKRDAPNQAFGFQRRATVSYNTSLEVMMKSKKGEDAVNPDEITLRDLIFFVMDGFPNAMIAAMYPKWLIASVWMERVNFLFILLSVVSIATETLPQYYTENYQSFATIEIICIVFFTLDFVLRIICTRNRVQFCQKLRNWIDLISILPFFVSLGVKGGTSNLLLRLLRMIRILRVLKLSRNNIGLMAVSEAVRESSEAITMLFFLLIVALVLFSSLMFYAEQTGETFDTNSQQWIRNDNTVSPFQSIFHTMWWCIVTMTTVGYGDDVPVTPLGKIVGSATMLCGVFVLAFPTVILSTNFQEIHQSKVEGFQELQAYAEAQDKAAKRRQEELRLRQLEEERQRTARKSIAELVSMLSFKRAKSNLSQLSSQQQLVRNSSSMALHPVQSGSSAGSGKGVGGNNQTDVEMVNVLPGSPLRNDTTNDVNNFTPRQQVGDAAAADEGCNGPDGNSPQDDLPNVIPFEFNPYANANSNTTEQTEVEPSRGNTFSTQHTQSMPNLTVNEDGMDTKHMKELVILDDKIAIYNPVMFLRCSKDRHIRAKAETFHNKAIVTLQLCIESEMCQDAAEEALRHFRPDIAMTASVLPRPINKMKVHVECGHPMLRNVRLLCETFLSPLGIVPLSLVVPSKQLVNVLMSNLGCLSIVTWVSYDTPSTIHEPLLHYGGMMLAGTGFEDEEQLVHEARLVDDVVNSNSSSLRPTMVTATSATEGESTTKAPRSRARLSELIRKHVQIEKAKVSEEVAASTELQHEGSGHNLADEGSGKERRGTAPFVSVAVSGA